MVQAQQAQGGKLPFRYATRVRTQRVGFVPFQENTQATPLELPRVGFLMGLLLEWRGSISGTGVSAKTTGPWAVVRRFRLGLNLGAATIYDTSGYGNYLLNLANGTALNSVPGYSSTSNWYYFIPVSANLTENFTTGLILLQDPQVRATLDITWGALSDAFNGTGLTAATGSGIEVYYVYAEVPDLSKASMPPLVLHRVIEDTQPITQTGDNAYTVPRQGVLLQLLHTVRLNGDFSTAWTRAQVRLNRTDTIVDLSPGAAYLLDAVDRKGQGSLPQHAVFFDFFRAMGHLGQGDLRDALDTEAVTTTESIITIDPTATLGTNNNFLGSIRRILQPIRV